MSNNPPYATVHLDQAEFEYLTKLLSVAGSGAKTALEDVAGMSSSDPRAPMRSLLVMAAGVDVSMTARLSEKLVEGAGSI